MKRRGFLAGILGLGATAVVGLPKVPEAVISAGRAIGPIVSTPLFVGGDIVAGTITSEMIADGTITAGKIAVGNFPLSRLAPLILPSRIHSMDLISAPELSALEFAGLTVEPAKPDLSCVVQV